MLPSPTCTHRHTLITCSIPPHPHAAGRDVGLVVFYCRHVFHESCLLSKCHEGTTLQAAVSGLRVRSRSQLRLRHSRVHLCWRPLVRTLVGALAPVSAHTYKLSRTIVRHLAGLDAFASPHLHLRVWIRANTPTYHTLPSAFSGQGHAAVAAVVAAHCGRVLPLVSKPGAPHQVLD